jgi:hypothetical protein
MEETLGEQIFYAVDKKDKVGLEGLLKRASPADLAYEDGWVRYSSYSTQS